MNKILDELRELKSGFRNFNNLRMLVITGHPSLMI